MKKKLLIFIFLFSMAGVRCAAMNISFGFTFPNGDDYRNAACSESTGYIHPGVSGGIPPYTYLWSTGDITLNIDNIPAGTYTLTVHDATGDSVVASLVITGGPIEFTFVAPPFMPCYNHCSGVAVYHTLSTYFNGTPPYTFSSSYGYLNNGFDAYSNSFVAGSTTLEQLCDGINVTVNVTDAFGCTGQETFNLPGTPIQNPTFSITPSCDSMNNGSVTVSNLNLWSFVGGTAMEIISDTNLFSSCFSGSYNSDPFTVTGLTPGVWYLAINYGGTDYTCGWSTGFWGCPQYIPFTIPDLGPNPPVPNITLVFDSLVSDAAVGYQWYFNSVLIPGATSQAYHPTLSGNYSVVITGANSCTASSTAYPFILTETRDLTNESEILIYPNPANDELIVRNRDFGAESVITIYNAIGEKFFSQKLKANSQQQVIDVSVLRSGIYLVEVKTEKEFLRGKFMKL